MTGITIFWIVLMVIFIIIELNTINLYTVWFALGACAAAILSVQMPEGYLVQTAAFVIVSGIAVMLTRPFARKVTGKSVPTNADRVVGEEAVVTEKIGESALGQVKVLGHIWTAKAKDANTVYDVGDIVIVEEIQGVKLIVKDNDNRPVH
ncbi:MAG: NfeD family protein [Defluviitaleaceae bacterium]|nr:NfeD family protein [Defluviitaleaceae bacterium]